jgi:hypothetical protein
MLEVPKQARSLAVLLLSALAWLVAAEVAHGQAGATVTPNAPGKGTRLHWEVDGTAAPISGQIPRSLTMSAPPGFVLNTAAAAKRCTSVQAKLDECPSKSRIGSAQMVIHVEKPSGPRDLPIDIKLYLGSKNSLMAVAFLAGVRVVPGSIAGSNGVTLTFNPLPVPPAIQGVSYRFLGVKVDLGVTRKVIRKLRRHHKGHHRKARVKVVRRINLVTTPSSCAAGSWTLSTSVGLPDGTAPLFSSQVPC